MTTKKISQLTELTTPDNNDVLVINDVSALQTKKITFQNLSSHITSALSQSITASIAAESSARAEAIATANASLSFTLTGFVNTTVGNSATEVKASESLARSQLSSSINNTINYVSQSIVNNVTNTFNTNIQNLSQSLTQNISTQINNVSQSITEQYSAVISNVTQSLSQSLSNYTYVTFTNLSQSFNQTVVSETINRNAAISEATASLAPVTYVINTINAESNARATAISNVSASFVISITNLSQSITQSIAAESSQRTTAISNVSSSLVTTVSALSQSITASLALEATNRTNAINSAISGLASISYVNSAVSGVAGSTPGGSSGQIQYNNSGNFGGVSNLTWNGSSLFITGSFKGNIDGNAATATVATTATTSTTALTASLATVATTATSLATTTHFVSLNGTADGSSTNIGSIYIPNAITISTNSLAYIGGSTASETAYLYLIPINSVTPTATWTRTNILGSVGLASPVSLTAGWYDIVLDVGSEIQTSFAKGLFLTS